MKKKKRLAAVGREKTATAAGGRTLPTNLPPEKRKTPTDISSSRVNKEKRSSPSGERPHQPQRSQGGEGGLKTIMLSFLEDVDRKDKKKKYLKKPFKRGGNLKFTDPSGNISLSIGRSRM